MKQLFLTISITLFALCAAGNVQAQHEFRNASGNQIGKVQTDGTVRMPQANSWEVESNGTVHRGEGSSWVK